MSERPQLHELGRQALLPAGEMARYFSGGPFLVVSTDLVKTAAHGLGADTIFAEIAADTVRFFFPESAQAVDFAEGLPSDVLAIISTAENSESLRAIWVERGLEPPPSIVAEALVDALGPILTRMRAEIGAVTARCEELQRALVTTRAEFEETRSAMQGVMRTLSHRYATKMNLVAAVAPSRDMTVMLDTSNALRRVYPVGTEGLTCFALHVSALQQHVSPFVLKVLLIGTESGRVLGEWRRPRDALFDGWNTFDFPTPLAAVRETLAIEVALEGEPGCAMAFSLGGHESVGGEAPFAIRIWTADAGGRFPYARHWIWNAQGIVRPVSGTAALVDADSIARISMFGRIEVMHEPIDGAAASYLIRGGHSLLCLRGISIQDIEGICIEIARSFGDFRNTHFELTAQAGGSGISSGKQQLDAAHDVLKLGLSLPASLPDTVDLYLRIDDGERAGHEFAVIAIKHIEFIAGQRLESGIKLDAAQIDPEELSPSDGRQAGPRFEAIKVANYSETEKFALLEVTLDRLVFGGRVESGVKFKISVSQGRLSLEFRQGKNWPRIFQQWPGREQDRFGDVFRVAQSDTDLMIAGNLETDADRDILAALCLLMPTVVVAGVQTLPSAAKRIPAWLDAARAFAKAAQQAFGGSVA